MPMLYILCTSNVVMDMLKVDFLNRLERDVRKSFDFFDYSLLQESFSQNDKIEIKCPIHGIFKQRAVSHLLGFSCASCSGLKVSNRDAFIGKAKAIHGERYNYDNLVYVNNRTDVDITCELHGDFKQSPKVHLRGGGCRHCAGNVKLSTSIFIARAEARHGKRYDYSLASYNTTKGKVKIICPDHGIFEQAAEDHWLGDGCPICAFNARLNLAEFIRRSELVHGKRYDYSNSIFKGARNQIGIICPEHGEFFQQAYDHYKGHGCWRCSESSGERDVALILEELGVSYIREYSFDNNRFRYDFFLTDLNQLVEFHGKQHYEAIEHFGGGEALKITQQRDRKKIELALRHNVPLLIVNYLDQTDGLLRDKLINYMGRED